MEGREACREDVMRYETLDGRPLGSVKSHYTSLPSHPPSRPPSSPSSSLSRPSHFPLDRKLFVARVRRVLKRGVEVEEEEEEEEEEEKEEGN